MATSKPIANYIRGDSRAITITVTKPDGITPFDLTGCKVYFTVNANKNNTASDDSSAVISLSTSTFTAPLTGIATLQLTNAQTQTLTPGVYYYDAQVKDISGGITSLPQNTFTVVPDVTRSTA